MSSLTRSNFRRLFTTTPKFPYLIVQSQQWKHQNVWHPTSVHSQQTIKIPERCFWFLHSWLWTSKCRLKKSLLLRNNDIRLKFWPEIPKDLSLWGNPACYILSRISDIPIATPRIAPQMLKVLALDVKWPGIDRDALNAYQKLWKGHVFQGGFIIYELLKDFTNCRNMSHKAVIFGSTLFCPTALRDHSFSTYAKFSVKLTFLTPWHAHVRKR